MALAKSITDDEEIKARSKIAINVLKNFCLENFLKTEPSILESSKFKKIRRE